MHRALKMPAEKHSPLPTTPPPDGNNVIIVIINRMRTGVPRPSQHAHCPSPSYLTTTKFPLPLRRERKIKSATKYSMQMRNKKKPTHRIQWKMGIRFKSWPGTGLPFDSALLYFFLRFSPLSTSN